EGGLAMYELPRSLLDETFTHFRRCGRGVHECQVLWLSPWAAPERITRVVHPAHTAHSGGFQLDSRGLSRLLGELSASGEGIRVQVHTHPEEASHSLPAAHDPI